MFTIKIKQMAFYILFVIATFYKLDIDQIDIKTAFLYSLINQLIYVKQPKDKDTKNSWDFIFQLYKVLYNLKQSLRLWYKRLSTFLLEKLRL